MPVTFAVGAMVVVWPTPQRASPSTFTELLRLMLPLEAIEPR